jgi:predicted HAD superfamily hydrolase
MSFGELEAVSPDSFDLVSTDIFDTVLLRDLSLEVERFVESSEFVAKALAKQGRSVSVQSLTRLRLLLHTLAYRAISIERPDEEIKIRDIYALQARLLGNGGGIQDMLHEAELNIESKRLSPNRRLLSVLRQLAASGKKIVATSDTYYSTCDLNHLLKTVIGENPIAQVYASSDLGLTKRSGRIFLEVAARERIPISRILHIGDNLHADVQMARAAGCQAVHLPRHAIFHIARVGRGIFRRPWRFAVYA